MVLDEEELRWFFDHIIVKPLAYETYMILLACCGKTFVDMNGFDSEGRNRISGNIYCSRKCYNDCEEYGYSYCKKCGKKSVALM